MLIQTDPTARNAPDLPARVASTLGLGPTRLHGVDFDDLFVPEGVLRVLQELADAALRGLEAPVVGPLFSAYWVEDNLELVICASTERSMRILRVPHGHWSLRPAVCH
ncbi:hypothetical protein JCM15519_32860 [Fundidesulfovibrio butyratiphilus]